MTLLEVLVAGILLSVGLVAGLEVIARCAHTAQQVEARSRGLMFARAKLEEVLKQPTLQTGSERGAGMEGESDAEFDWDVAIEPVSSQQTAAQLMNVTVLVTHRATGVETVLTCVRRPDQSAPQQEAAP